MLWQTKFRRATFPRLVLLIAASIFGVMFAFGITRLTPLQAQVYTSAHNDGGLLITPRPDNLENLVASSNIIAVGTVKALVHEESFAGYDDKGNLIKAQEKGLPPETEVSFFDYTLELEQVFFSDSTLAQPGSQVILRMFVKGTEPKDRTTQEFPPSIPGDRNLFFLYHNPDGKTYGLRFATASRIWIDGPVATFSDGQRTPVNFGSQFTPAEFIQAVKEIVRSQKDQ